MKKLFVLTLVLVQFTLLSCSRDKTPLGPGQDNTPTGQGEIYDIYSAIVKNMFVGENTKLVVVRDSTVNQDFSYNQDYLLEQFPQLNKELIEAFNEANRERKKLDKIPGLQLPCVLLSDQEMEEIFANGWWQEFYRRFPNSSGYISLSVPVFSGDGKLAFLYADSVQGGLAGAGYAILLEKNDRWRIVKTVMLWIS